MAKIGLAEGNNLNKKRIPYPPIRKGGKNMKKALALLLVGLFWGLLVACATTTPTGREETPGVIAESPPVLVMGSKFVFQETNLVTGKVTSTFTWIVKERKEYEGKPSYWVDTTGGKGENFNVYDLNLNWMAYIKKEVEQTSASPCIKEFSWPLRVGKKWNTFYDYWDRSRGSSFRGASEPVKVESYEEVKVPAGTFQTFKIVREARTFKVTFWYAPSVGISVKRQIERTADNPLGYGRILAELIEYSIPK